MKIISKFKDYYDSALGFGHDDSCVYVRHTGVVGAHLSPDTLPWKYHHKTPGMGWRNNSQRSLRVQDATLPPLYRQKNIHEAFVCVAGQAYSVFVFETGTHYSPVNANTALEGHSDPSKISTAFFSETLSDQTPRFSIQDNLTEFSEAAQSSYENTRSKFLQHDFTSLHLDLESPVLLLLNPEYFPNTVCEKDKKANVLVVKNPSLDLLHMQNVLPPFTCFQNIEQFLSGVVPGCQMPLVQISDQDMVRKKGFDPKYGFRTRPHE